MEHLKINIEIALSAETIALLKAFLPNCTTATPCAESKAVETAPAPERQKAAPKTKTEKQPEPPVVEETLDDIPDGAMITDAELRRLTADAKNKSSAADVRAIFQTFDIRNSSACPIDKRPALKQELLKLITA
jgi:hypothetical protein